MLRILWFALLVSPGHSGRILQFFSSTFDMLKVNLTPLERFDQNFNEDGKLTTTELVAKYGYTAEIHQVLTEDGYELTLHRIAGSPRSPPQFGKTVCFLQHGLMDSSAGWVLSGPNHALAFLLADEGYDVWLGNSRGNLYSTNAANYFDSFPKFLPRIGKSFWSFSWHEIGFYDLPASIDYVLAKTGKAKLHYIGHSQGTTAFFVMASERPEYNDKIEVMHALAPVAFLSSVKSAPVHILEQFRSTLQQLFSVLNVNFVPPNPSKLSIVRALPFTNLPLQFSSIQKVFLRILESFYGPNSDQLNPALIPIIQGQMPAGCAINQLLHYGQNIRTGRFQHFDPDFFNNFVAIKNDTFAPDYNLENINAPVALFYSNYDFLAGAADVQLLKNRLPNVIEDFQVTEKVFNHVDFLWGVDAPRIIYNRILKIIKSSNEQ